MPKIRKEYEQKSVIDAAVLLEVMGYGRRPEETMPYIRYLAEKYNWKTVRKVENEW